MLILNIQHNEKIICTHLGGYVEINYLRNSINYGYSNTLVRSQWETIAFETINFTNCDNGNVEITIVISEKEYLKHLEKWGK